jgi:predicted TIM-barrel fold metal-dependent hydrolase
LLFEPQIFASQMLDGAELARAFPDTVFVLEHAGMLEDLSSAGWQLWRDGMAALAQCRNVNVKLSGLGTFVHACRDDVIGPIVKETVARFSADRCFFGSNFPIEKLCTEYGALCRTFRKAIAYLGDAEQAAILHDTAARRYRI